MGAAPRVGRKSPSPKVQRAALMAPRARGSTSSHHAAGARVEIMAQSRVDTSGATSGLGQWGQRGLSRASRQLSAPVSPAASGLAAPCATTRKQGAPAVAFLPCC